MTSYLETQIARRQSGSAFKNENIHGNDTIIRLFEQTTRYDRPAKHVRVQQNDSSPRALLAE